MSLSFNRSLEPCTRTRFIATANATGKDTRIVIRRDGKVVGSGPGHQLQVRIEVKDLKPGRHVVRATVSDRFDRTAASARTFQVCKPGGGGGDDDD